jgi:predicted RNA binding protein YcfA (HicA-like mRNA interferase family)
MPKLPHISGAQAVKIFERLGFVVMRQNGSHIVLRKGSSGCVVPNHKEIKSRSAHWQAYSVKQACRQMNFCGCCMTSAIGKNEFMGDREINVNSHETSNQTASTEVAKTDWHTFVGLLNDSPCFKWRPD